MFDVPGANIVAVYINEDVVTGTKKAEYITGPIETTDRPPEDEDGPDDAVNVTTSSY